eukprot:1875334-Prymnesium_polylepis.1
MVDTKAKKKKSGVAKKVQLQKIKVAGWPVTPQDPMGPHGTRPSAALDVRQRHSTAPCVRPEQVSGSFMAK